MPAPDFAVALRARVEALIAEGLDAERDSQARIAARNAGLRGVSWPSGSFAAWADRAGRFHLNIPASTARPEVLDAIRGLVAELGREHGVEMSGAREVMGGSNWVLEGVLLPAPAPEPRL